MFKISLSSPRMSSERSSEEEESDAFHHHHQQIPLMMSTPGVRNMPSGPSSGRMMAYEGDGEAAAAFSSIIAGY